MIKRQIYGKADLTLLRHRILLSQPLRIVATESATGQKARQGRKRDRAESATGPGS
jgi:hypothetical protein